MLLRSNIGQITYLQPLKSRRAELALISASSSVWQYPKDKIFDPLYRVHCQGIGGRKNFLSFLTNLPLDLVGGVYSSITIFRDNLWHPYFLSIFPYRPIAKATPVHTHNFRIFWHLRTKSFHHSWSGVLPRTTLTLQINYIQGSSLAMSFLVTKTRFNLSLSLFDYGFRNLFNTKLLVKLCFVHSDTLR